MSAKQVEAFSGICAHDTWEDVLSEAGKALAVRCTACTKLLGSYGVCHGCRNPRKLLTVRVEAKGKTPALFYCSKDCRAAQLKEERKAKDEKAKLGPKVTPNPARQR